MWQRKSVFMGSVIFYRNTKCPGDTSPVVFSVAVWANDSGFMIGERKYEVSTTKYSH